MKGQAYRAPTAVLMTDAELWDTAVAGLLGPVVTQRDREQRRTNALALAAAALRAAGEGQMAADLLVS